MWGQRAMELCEAIFVAPFEIDEKLVHDARCENFEWLSDDKYWDLAISEGLSDDSFRYLVTHGSDVEGRADHAVNLLGSDTSIDQLWREVLLKYAKAGRLVVPTTLKDG